MSCSELSGVLHLAVLHASCAKYVAASLELIPKQNYGVNVCDNERWTVSQEKCEDIHADVCDNEQCSASQGNSENMHVLHVTPEQAFC